MLAQQNCCATECVARGGDASVSATSHPIPSRLMCRHPSGAILRRCRHEAEGGRLGFLEAVGFREQILWSLHALGGEATLGDLLTLTGLLREDLERSIDSLIARGQADVRVLEYGDLTYHLSETEAKRHLGPGRSPLGLFRHSRRADLAKARRILFDRKTLRLLRARDGVLSLAELVEQTGLPLRDAEKEMTRLAGSWGGEPHAGLDGHIVFAFPELMSSVHGRFAGREPRPAWVRIDDPMDHNRERRRRARVGMSVVVAGAATAVAGPFVLGAALAGTPLLGAAAFAIATGASLVAFGVRLVRLNHRRFRFSQPEAIRRFVLGYVIETALAGKGVVSLKRARQFIQNRAGKAKVKRATVEGALRDLAADFDAPITTQGDDLFFGFRNVKRQFLASYLMRRELRLGNTVTGATVFDSEDTELQAFDRELLPPGAGGESSRARDHRHLLPIEPLL